MLSGLKINFKNANKKDEPVASLESQPNTLVDVQNVEKVSEEPKSAPLTGIKKRKYDFSKN